MGPRGLWWTNVLNSDLPPQKLRPDTWPEHQDPVSHTAQNKREKKERKKERTKERKKERKEGGIVRVGGRRKREEIWGYMYMYS